MNINSGFLCLTSGYVPEYLDVRGDEHDKGLPGNDGDHGRNICMLKGDAETS